MIISKINSAQNFGKVFVSPTKSTLFSNFGHFHEKERIDKYITNSVIKPFNEKILNQTKQSNDCNIFSKYQNDTDFWIMPSNLGKYFIDIAQKMYTPTNEFLLPIKMDDGSTICMLDWAMATATPCAKNNKIEYYIAENPSYSLGDIIEYNQKILKSGKNIKDTVIYLNDRVFDLNPRELHNFILETIKNPKKVMGIIGAEATSKEAEYQPILSVLPNKETLDKDKYLLNDFVLAMTKEDVQKNTTSNGTCIINTGVFVIKKEAMKALLDEIAINPNVIKKFNSIRYDNILACKWIKNKFGTNACDVKVFRNWIDLHYPYNFFSFLNKVKKGHFLECFGKYGDIVKNSIAKRFNYDEKTKEGELLLSDRWNTLKEIPQKVKDETFPSVCDNPIKYNDYIQIKIF